MAGRIIAYRSANCGSDCKTKLYMGALNRLDLKKNITPSTERWLAFVKATPAIEGVNIHPHVPKIELSKAFLDYILPRMRPEQTFIVPEFSLVGWSSEERRVGKSGSVRVDLGGRRLMKKKNKSLTYKDNQKKNK